MKKNNNKGYTLIELIIIMALIGFLASLSNNFYSSYLAGGIEDRKKDNIKLLGVAFQNEVIEKNDIPDGFCSNDGVNYIENDLCFDPTGCLEVKCDSNNNYCKNSGNGNFYNFNKFLEEHNYEKDVFNINFNNLSYKICKDQNTNFAFQTESFLNEGNEMYKVGDETFINPSFMLYYENNGIKEEIVKYIKSF